MYIDIIIDLQTSGQTDGHIIELRRDECVHILQLNRSSADPCSQHCYTQ